MRGTGAGVWSASFLTGGSLADIAIGVGVAIRPFTRPTLFAALGASLFYAFAGTLVLPALW